MSINSYLGALASSSEAVAKGLANKHPFLSVAFFMLSGFFWAGEALTETPDDGITYWENIKDKLKIRFDQNQTSTMKWALGAGVFTMVSTGISLAALIVGAGPLSWLGIATVGFGIATAVSWYNASKWSTTSGTFNKLAAGGQFTFVALGFAAVLAPAVTILGIIASIASYISTGLWLLSYPAKELVDEADELTHGGNAVPPAQVGQSAQAADPKPPTHTQHPYVSPRLPTGRIQVTFYGQKKDEKERDSYSPKFATQSHV